MALTIESASRIIDGINNIIPTGQSLLQSGERAVNRMLENIAGTRYDGETGVGRAQLATLINKKLGLLSHQESPDVNGYTFIVMTPPDLSGLADASSKQSIQDICNNVPFFAIEVTPPNITINTEEINTQASVSMPYATAKIATGQMSVTYIDNANMDINSLHNVWIEYIYGQLWGDFKPSSQYWDEDRYPATAGTIDYSASMYILKYDPSLSEPPVMFGKATGIFPFGLPVKETLGSRSSRELVMQNVSYTCSYYEVIHPKAAIQIKSLSGESFRGTILDEAYAAVTHKYSKYDTVDGLIKS